jgi:hypothetical protein
LQPFNQKKKESSQFLNSQERSNHASKLFNTQIHHEKAIIPPANQYPSSGNLTSTINHNHIKTHKVSLKNSLNQKRPNFSKFEINIVENKNKINLGNVDIISPKSDYSEQVHPSETPSTPSFLSSKHENEIQIKFIVHKEGWKRKKRITHFIIVNRNYF